jgi:hypothetical protein
MRCRFVPVREQRRSRCMNRLSAMCRLARCAREPACAIPSAWWDVRELVIAAAIDPHKIAKSRK